MTNVLNHEAEHGMSRRLAQQFHIVASTVKNPSALRYIDRQSIARLKPMLRDAAQEGFPGRVKFLHSELDRMVSLLRAREITPVDHEQLRSAATELVPYYDTQINLARIVNAYLHPGRGVESIDSVHAEIILIKRNPPKTDGVETPHEPHWNHRVMPRR